MADASGTLPRTPRYANRSYRSMADAHATLRPREQEFKTQESSSNHLNYSVTSATSATSVF
ncbi:hypothetical protein H6G73_10000 [Richelia sinica FACHB-800]|nr:hypothetical protein [Richelia sinica FACHB-800]